MSNFDIFLYKSENLRHGYVKSLEKVDVNFKEKWLEHFSIVPTFFDEIYSNCNGTKQDIPEQIFFDFLPGYRLMQVDEILDSYEKTFKNCVEYDVIIPFLTDYSGCYYAYAVANGRESIVLLIDGVLEMIHSQISDFGDTIVAFYDEKVYFLDEYGYLSYDYEKEGEIGKKYNKDISYWGWFFFIFPLKDTYHKKITTVYIK